MSLKRVSPSSQALEALDSRTDALAQSKSDVAAHGITANASGLTTRQLTVAHQLNVRHTLPAMVPSQLAHDGPVLHILVLKDREVTSGGVRARWTLREWSVLGKLIASHKACNKGIPAVEQPCPQIGT